MRILILEPYYTGSHKRWANGLMAKSCHNVQVIDLPGRHWKWRMHGAAITFSQKVNALSESVDLIIATDMLDVATFRGLLASKFSDVPIVLYLHENQLSYPWSARDSDRLNNRDNHYAFVNYTSALAANKVLFNSEYHRSSFLSELPSFLQLFPDYQNSDTVDVIFEKSEVLSLGVDLTELDEFRPLEVNRPKRATILWNHRWEYDKNPEEFFEALFEIQRRGWDFNLVVLGEKFKNSPNIFDEAQERLKDHILHWGFANSRADYVKWLWHSDILPVTSNQDFFGGSVVEAMFCNVKPLLPSRLAYPEHIPENLRHVFFYEDGELVDKLQRWIRDVSVLRKQQTRSFVEKYDWSNLIQKYDEVFASVKVSSRNR